VFFRLGRRAIGLVTGFFALLGFIAVPIGERTGYEHVKAALATPEGHEAVAAVSRAYSALREKFCAWAFEKLGQATATGVGTKTNALNPSSLLDGRDRDPVDNHGSLRGNGTGVVGHNEDAHTIFRSGSREDTGVLRREER
jgi:hypothetical protein